MKKFNFWLVAIGYWLLAIITVSVFALDPNVGTTSFNFLKIGVGARATSLGGAYAGIGGDVNSLYWNPGGLGILDGKEGTATYMNYIVGMQSGYLGYGQRWNKNSVFGIGISYLSVGSIKETTVNDPTGAYLGTFTPSNMALGLSYARTVSKDIYGGITFKGMRESIKSYSSMGFAFDIGIYYITPYKGVTFGSAFLNLGKKTKAFIKEKEPLPWIAKAGVAYRVPKFKENLLLALEVDKPGDNRFELHLGGEVRIRKIAFIRAGYNSSGTDLKTSSDIDILGGLSFGVGGVYKTYRVDYSWTPYVDLGNAHRVSLTARF